MHATFFQFVAYILLNAQYKRKELKMRFRTKFAILLAAVLLSVVGFNLIATSPALDLLRVGKTAGHEITATDLTKTEAAPHYSSS